MKYLLFITLTLISFTDLKAEKIYVPADFLTIQDAIDHAQNSDTVILAKGLYRENLKIKDKFITLASEFLISQDSLDIQETLISGQRNTVLSIWNADYTQIIGLSIINGNDGISTNSNIIIRHNNFYNNIDAIDYEGGGGECLFNSFHSNIDDAIDLDESAAVTISHNKIYNNRDDGIEIRCHKTNNNKELYIEISNNYIQKNDEDGIQIIFYPNSFNRKIVIKNNVIEENTMAGVGCMADGNTKEDYSSAIAEFAIEILDNTFTKNHYGLSGSGNIKIEGNVFNQQIFTAIKSNAELHILKRNTFLQNELKLIVP